MIGIDLFRIEARLCLLVHDQAAQDQAESETEAQNGGLSPLAVLVMIDTAFDDELL